MVIYYNADGKITNSETFVTEPVFPPNKTLAEKKQIYFEKMGVYIHGLPYELDAYVFDYKVIMEPDGSFIRLEPVVQGVIE